MWSYVKPTKHLNEKNFPFCLGQVICTVIYKKGSTVEA